MNNLYGTYITGLELAQWFKLYESRDISNELPDGRLTRLVERTSRDFEAACGRRIFIPWHETRTYNHPVKSGYALKQAYGQYRTPYASQARDHLYLNLDEDLLDLITLTTNNGATTLASTDYFLRYFDRQNFRPYNNIELIWTGLNQPVFTYTSTPQQANSVAGIWGYHEDYDRAWPSVGTSNEALNADLTDNTIIMTDVDGTDERGVSPRYHIGNLIRIGDDETGEQMY